MKVLMCPPRYFSVDYEINPWMNKETQVYGKLAQTQWETLVDLYKSLGLEVETVDPVRGLPDMVFTANAGLVKGDKAVVANFKYPERQPESEHFKKWFEHSGLEIIKLHRNEYFEGQGEALWFGDTLVAGWGFRASLESHLKLQQLVAPKLLSVKLIDPKYYHLDTCFLPVNATTAAYFPLAFDFSARKDLQELIPNLIELTKEDAEAFACNSVVIDKKILMPTGATYLPRELEKLGLEVIQLDTSEFKKSGGGIRCLTLNLD